MTGEPHSPRRRPIANSADALAAGFTIGASDTAAPEIVARADAPGPRIERLARDGRTLWIKRPARDDRPVWLAAQRVLARLVPLDFLKPAPGLDGAGAIAREVGMITALRAGGFHVPEIVYASSRAIVLGDLGPTIAAIARDARASGDRGDLRAALLLASAALARLHAAGHVHGRPSLRDFTFDGETVGFLDFEEMPTAVMPFAVAAARDVWLWSIQVFHAMGPDDTEAILRTYVAGVRPDVEAELKRALRLLAPVARALNRPVTRFGNRELRRSVGGTLVLARLLAERGVAA
ncbi:serine/threonine protein phosphatase [Methylobrevis albus]|uniref:Serine/threonine protein phosphatase n=1 Tax=Methylobrevis albus TaxID=2793297 RepID=A0A931I044_9HYPH|nr:serine/threonine protein phosphatase [Methylobrevis albus]MBH0236806.1 serine/threonine protein phosphatase [Methylobrevis albus]